MIKPNSLVRLFFVFATAFAFPGCKTATPDCTDPIVHPTDEQINRATPGATSSEPAYTPWWVIQ